ncbi:MAG: MarR family transcriptional regulator [Vulcanibacillus sp.]
MKDKTQSFNDLMESIFELSRAYHDYQCKPRKYGTNDDLFMVEVHLLNLIGENSKINVTEISKKTNRTKGAVSQIIDKLVNKGIVYKNKNPLNNREVKLELSEEGQKIFNYHKLLDKEKNESILLGLTNFTDNDFSKYIIITNKIIKNMKNV